MIGKLSDFRSEGADRQAITGCMHLYARGVDRADADLLRDVFWEDARIVGELHSGGVAEFIEFSVPGGLKNWDRMMHMITNPVIRIDGDRAVSESYFYGYHVGHAGATSGDLVITLLLAGFDTSKNELTLTMHALLDHPDIYERCAADIGYCRKVIQESLRRTSVVSPNRTLYEDVTYQGILFPNDIYICFAVALTGRDPAIYREPMAFLPEREQQPRHIAFGRGTHI